ncbi:MAG: hypothetical protein KDA44_09165 [Planctomycetales bacterium]|nr:hypothetical protein [Planctomycetales bacterium]
MKTSLAILSGLLFAVVGSGRATAVQLLANPNLEDTGNLMTGIPGWDLDEFFTTAAGSPDSASQVTFANNPVPPSTTDGSGLWLKPFASGGGTTPYVDNVNAVLSQVVPAVPGESYTFSADARWELDFSGGNDPLFGTGPLGAVASPTSTNIVMEFLDASDNVIGAPLKTDLKADGQTIFSGWLNHSVAGTAPAGTVSVRVIAEGRDMVWNSFDGSGASQSAFFDNFTLNAGSAPMDELLTNASFDETPPVPPEFPGWTVTVAERDVNGDPVLDFPATSGIGNQQATWASRNAAAGEKGAWLKAFAGGIDGDAVDASLSQTLAAIPGGSYTFSGYVKWEGNYSGAVTTIDPTSDTVRAGEASPTETFLMMEFLDAGDAVLDTAALDLRTVQVADGSWQLQSVSGVAPANTANVRVTAGATDMVFNIDPQQSAFFDDFTLEGPSAGTPGDFDSDGDVDGDDFLAWQRGYPATKTPADLADWQANFGAASAAAVASATPEPSSLIIAIVALCGGAAAGRRRWRA